MAKITRLMHFESDRSLRKLAERVIRAYPEEFGHIELDRVEFLMETTGKPSGAAAVCHKVSILARSAMAIRGTGIDWVIAFFSCAAEGRSTQWMQLVMFHELLHIGTRGGLVEHDVEDFAQVLRMAGIDWTSDNNLPDIIRKKIRLVA